MIISFYIYTSNYVIIYDIFYNPATRKLIQVKLEDVEKYVHHFKWQENEINKILKTEFNP